MTIRSGSATVAIKTGIIAVCRSFGVSIKSFDRHGHDEYLRHKQIWSKFQTFTMVPEVLYIDNLRLASLIRDVGGDIIECGVWRGGMIAGIAELLGNERKYWLFDSFEGLPPAQEIDGLAAIRYQKDPQGEWYFNNCTADESEARHAMELATTHSVAFVKGWFKDTVHQADVGKIALLRLDGDWYESTMTCLEAFYPRIVEGGIVIIDDYHTWDGCARAVHDFLSRRSLADRIRQSLDGNAYIIKGQERAPSSTNPRMPSEAALTTV
jgi:O-methyltransferase